MTGRTSTVRYRPLTRLEPAVFSDSPVAMVATTTSGVVVEVNEAATELFGRKRYELVQEPLGRHVSLTSPGSIVDRLRAAATAPDLSPFGTCAVRRRDGDTVTVDLTAASACRELGRDLVLLRLATLPPVV